jgi:predicted kinase
LGANRFHRTEIERGQFNRGEDGGLRIACQIAADNLRLGLNVVADSCNPVLITRRAWEAVAARSGATYPNIVIICSDKDEHRRRVETRTSSVPGLTLPTWEEVEEREYHAWSEDRLVIETSGKSERESADDLYQALGLMT